MRALRIPVVVGLALLDGLAAVAVARLAAGPPWRAAPLDAIDGAAFAAGALCAPFLLYALLRSAGAVRTILLGSLDGVLAAVMTAVLVVLVAVAGRPASASPSCSRPRSSPPAASSAS
jgi:hypothetical protein